MNDKKSNKICGVCGDTALCRNFGAISCESCKAFFRRSAFKLNSLECGLNGKCDINVNSRHMCQKCRLVKCLAIGMRKDLIRSVSENKMRQKLISQNQCKQNQLTNRMDVCTVTSTTHTLPNRLSLNRKNRDFIHNTISDENYCQEIDDLINDTFNHISDESLRREIMEIKSYITNGIQVVDRPLTDCTNQLSVIETNKLRQLLQAINVSANAIIPDSVAYARNVERVIGIRCPLLSRMIALTAQMFYNLVQLNDICDVDTEILKSYLFPVFMIRCVPNYESRNNTWTFMDNRTAISFNLNSTQHLPRNVYNLLINYYRMICQEWGCDTVLLDLLTAITMFNPNRPLLKHRDTVKHQQNIYKYLLQRYLLSRYGTTCESHRKYSKLMAILQELESMARNQWQNIAELEPQLIHTRSLLRLIFSANSMPYKI